MTQEEYESVQNRKYYVLMEDVPCWHWTRNKDNTFDLSIIGYNSKVVSPRKEMYEENIKNISDEFTIAFHQWMRLNDTQENAEKYFHYTDKDMLNEFKEDFYL